MRLWTVHPRYLDSKGLVAAWREALLAQKVLRGETKGYRHHPQLARFQAEAEPIRVVGTFLSGLAEEAKVRGYAFDESKIYHREPVEPILETRGQLLYEWEHLKNKLQVRAPELNYRYRNLVEPEAHPLFQIVPGEVKAWEKI